MYWCHGQIAQWSVRWYCNTVWMLSSSNPSSSKLFWIGLDWIEIHALLKYNMKMDQSWPFELKGRLDPGSLTTPREDWSSQLKFLGHDQHPRVPSQTECLFYLLGTGCHIFVVASSLPHPMGIWVLPTYIHVTVNLCMFPICTYHSLVLVLVPPVVVAVAVMEYSTG